MASATRPVRKSTPPRGTITDKNVPAWHKTPIASRKFRRRTIYYNRDACANSAFNVNQCTIMNDYWSFRLLKCVLFAATLWCGIPAAEAPEGFQGALWGMAPAQVRDAAGVGGWGLVADDGFPADLGVEVYETNGTVAGYQASIKYYFFEQRFFQATVIFDFSELENYDFNYNVFISVDRYYREIHRRTTAFVSDIYDLLRKKYGKKEPVFKGLDPRFIFARSDAYIRQELWNLRYHPAEYYKRIVAAAYARWDFPKTRTIFSINIAAPTKRFDYMLSLTSLDLEKEINERKDALRMEQL